MEHSKIFEKAKKYYTQGFWTETMLKALVEKGHLTKEELEEIVGGE